MCRRQHKGRGGFKGRHVPAPAPGRLFHTLFHQGRGSCPSGMRTLVTGSASPLLYLALGPLSSDN